MCLSSNFTEPEGCYFTLEGFPVKVVGLKARTVELYGMQFKDVRRVGRDCKHSSLDSGVCDNRAVQTHGDERNLFAKQLSVVVLVMTHSDNEMHDLPRG